MLSLYLQRSDYDYNFLLCASAILLLQLVCKVFGACRLQLLTYIAFRLDEVLDMLELSVYSPLVMG